jgi:DNA modification methylase
MTKPNKSDICSGAWENRITRSGTADPKELRKNPDNWRTHPKNQAAALEGVLNEVGWIQDVIVNERTGNMIDGHLRVELAVKHKEPTIPVKYVDLSEEEEKKAILTFDPIGAMAEADKALLDGLMKQVSSDSEAVSEMLDALAKEVGIPCRDANEVADDNYEPPAEIETDIKPGDIILLGSHRLMCGDSTSAEDVGRLMDGKKADLLLTDPPYGVSYASKNEFLNALDKGNRVQTAIENDHKKPEEMSAFWVAAFTTVREHMRPGASYYVTAGPQGGDLLLLLLALKEGGFPLRHMLIWAKNNHVLGRSDYHYKHEPIFYGWVEGAHTFYGGPSETSLWTIDKPHKSELHPTMKPIPLFAKAIVNSTKSGETVLDPFLGSGTTLIACEQLGRTCYGMEISPQYCQVIIDRWEKFTGNTHEVILSPGSR